MKKIILLILILFSIIHSWAAIELKSDKMNPFEDELVEISAIVPGTDLQAPTDLIINGSEYTILDTQKSEIFSYNDDLDKTISYTGYKIILLFKSPGKIRIQLNVNSQLSNEITLNVKPLNITTRVLPTTLTFINSQTLFVGENGSMISYLFSDKYIKYEYTRPFINMEVDPLNSFYKNNLYINDKKIMYQIISAFSFRSNTPGKYLIPQSYAVVDKIKYTIPSFNIDVIPLPIDFDKNTIIGKNLNIDILGLDKKYNYGERVYFKIKLSGDSNFSQLNSLNEYFNIPEFLTEEIEYRENRYKDGKVLNTIQFIYMGNLNSFVGFSIKGIKIPFFNTLNKELEYISVNNNYISGNIHFLLLYSIIFILLVIIVFIILFTIKFIQKRPNSVQNNNKPLEQFNFSKRENEIFIILVNGKTTKEIAEELSISPETVKKHIQNILKKTNTNSRIELLALINNIN